MPKTRKQRLLSVLAVCLVLVAGYLAFFNTAGANAPAKYTSQVTRMNLEEVVSSLGKLEPATYVDVGAQVSGQIVTLHVDLGDTVQKGDLLAEIDSRTFEARVEADRATLAQLEATQAERQATLVQAERNYRRDAALRRQNAASELDAQSSETAFKVAEAQVAAIEAQIRQARAQLESDELDLSYTMIYAPISGTVVSLEVKEGQTLNNNQSTPTLLRIAELQTMTVWASVSEADINKVWPGMDVYFTTIGDPNTRHYASVEKIHPSYTEENDVILYDVTFDVANPENAFLPAMNTQVFFVLAQADDVLALPLDMLPANQRNLSSITVSVLRPDGKEETRQADLGVRTRTFAEILSGLAEGEVVVKTAENSFNPAQRFAGPRL